MHRTHRLLTRVPAITVAVVLTVALAGGLGPAAAGAADAPPPPTAAPEHPQGGPAADSRAEPKAKTLAAAVATGRVDREVTDELARAGAVEVILTVDEGQLSQTVDASIGATSDPAPTARSRQVIDAMREGFGARKLGALGRQAGAVQVVKDFDNLPASQVRVTSAAALLALVNDPDVRGVRAIRTMEVGAMDPQSAPLVRQPQATAAGYTGAGTMVAVLDTGLDHTRSDFGFCTAANVPASCRVAANWEIASADGWLDDNGHGTNVSGIVAGIAPGTKLIGLDVFEGPTTSNALMLSAMNYLIGQRRAGVNVVAANLSIWTKGSVYPGACTDSLGFAAARAAGIVPVVIAGNGGSTGGVSFPGCIPGALTVGAVYDSNVGGRSYTDGACTDTTTFADKVTCFSQSGPNLKMLAPGAVITAAGISQSGTSQAAPHVAGAIAVMAAARPSAGVNGWEHAVVNSGPWITDRDGRARHRLDVYSSLQTLLGGSTGDTTPPTVKAPGQTVALNWSLGASVVPVTIRWSATDASGIATYSLYSSTNGGAWKPESLASATATSKTFSLTPGNRYQFTVAAKDGAGNWSAWTYAPSFVVAAFQENAAMTYSTGWRRQAWASAYGGFMTTSNVTNASVTFTFTGRSLAWVTTKAPNRGQAHVYLDGTYRGVWELGAASTTARVAALTANWANNGTHTLKIVVAGTAGRPAIDVDSFVVLR